ncbi:hypothetical protein LOAG_04028 [Loa loa]|uniref:Inhibitor of Apoptosis domain protein n=1 Tax=Loa loa TaxID=7209 RepID=A0A1I7V703_LOALO|nr:hypothetical protein LOAG_04028 [Loa loa]EFO24459.1 hypothetical protein LOAG_04028 [Loa loa]
MATVVDLLNCDAYTEHIFYNNRLKSFTKNAWPHHQSVNLSPEKMAQAGFFFDPDSDNADNVSCPFCLRSLTGWEDSDDPLVEHTKRKDVCYFARLGKDEKEWTVEDFLRLLAQRRASTMSLIALKAIDGARNAMKSVKKRIDVLTENKRQKKTAKRKK